MRLWDLLGSAWYNLMSHRLRSGLSILGIVIGIGSFSLMYSIGEGARIATIQSLNILGSDILSVEVNEDALPKTGGPRAALRFEDVESIQKECPSVTSSAAAVSGHIALYSKTGSETWTVTGSTPYHQHLFSLSPSKGRLLSELDIRGPTQNCVTGTAVAEFLFPVENPIGKHININGYRFRVVGTVDAPEGGSLSTTSMEKAILIPFPFALRLFPHSGVQSFYVRSDDTEKTILELGRFAESRFGTPDYFEITSQKQLIQARETLVNIFEYLLWAIGSISLLVGGIGIMNIMLVSVTERMREIGLRRALGATQRAILSQFLCESVLLCLFGAAGGALLAFGGSKAISVMTRFDPVFSPKLVLIALCIATFLGVLFGTYPATRAARQDISIVLRYD